MFAVGCYCLFVVRVGTQAFWEQKALRKYQLSFQTELASACILSSITKRLVAHVGLQTNQSLHPSNSLWSKQCLRLSPDVSFLIAQMLYLLPLATATGMGEGKYFIILSPGQQESTFGLWKVLGSISGVT